MPKSHVINVRIDKETKEKLDQLAQEEELPRSTIIYRIVKKVLLGDAKKTRRQDDKPSK